MFCRVIPYEGEESYIFVSYCHKDATRVYPIMEQMAMDGYRIWYDDGNHPGDDWLENIAQHLNDCTVCLAMISNNSAVSHNCRNELSFAIECRKTLLAVLLEDFPMPLGMKMQLGTIQHLKFKEYTSRGSMLEKLYEAMPLSACKADTTEGLLREAAPHENEREEITDPDFWNPNSDARERIDDFVAEDQANRYTYPKNHKDVAAQIEKKVKNAKHKVKVVAVKVGKEQLPADSAEKEIQNGDKANRGSLNVADVHLAEQNDQETEHCKAEIEAETPTIKAEDNLRVVLLHPATDACYYLNSALIRIGRSEHRCDIVISGNQSISNHHADIIRYNGRCYLRDARSANGTFINGERLPAEGKALLDEIDTFRLYNEFFQIIYGNAAAEMLAMERTISLTNKQNAQIRVLVQNKTILGRDKRIIQGLFEDPKVSRNHAEIFWRDGISYIRDLASTNGTNLNGNLLTPKSEYALSDGDILRIGDTSLEVRVIVLRGEEK